jgi:NADH-quinone oxidoreductase subunit C
LADEAVDTAEAPAEEAPALDERGQEVLDAFASHLGDAVLAHHVGPGAGLWIRVATAAWGDAAAVAAGAAELPFFDFLSAVDWMPSPYGRYEDAAVDTPFPPPMPDPSAIVPGYAGGETRLQVLGSVARPGTDLRVFLKADVPDDDPKVPTWVHAFSGASWHEREVWEMFGITFEGNPDQRHIYLPTEFEGHPLRKEYPLLARVVKPWPGIVDVEPMPGGDDEEEESTDE